MTRASMTDAPADLADRENRLLLFVAGDEPNSRLARENLVRVLEFVPEDCRNIRIIDIFEDYRPALEHMILVTPCLLMLGPDGPVRVVGNLNDTTRVRTALRIPNE